MQDSASGPGSYANLPYLNFDPVAGEYDATRSLPDPIVTEISRLLVKDAQLTGSSLMLDAGVGTGRFALPLAKLGIPVLGIDISEGMFHQLRVKLAGAPNRSGELTLRLVRGDLRTVPFQTAGCDAAMMVHILHLITSWREVIEEIRRVLKPGAPLYLSMERGRRQPTRDHYMELARLRGVLPEHRGVRNLDEAVAYAREHGAVCSEVPNEVRWQQSATVGTILDALERRTWSSLWDIPENVHEGLMAATRAWANHHHSDLSQTETSDVTLQVWKICWPALKA